MEYLMKNFNTKFTLFVTMAIVSSSSVFAAENVKQNWLKNLAGSAKSYAEAAGKCLYQNAEAGYSFTASGVDTATKFVCDSAPYCQDVVLKAGAQVASTKKEVIAFVGIAAIASYILKRTHNARLAQEAQEVVTTETTK